MLDAAIVGAGPAGLSAALDLKLLGKDFLWFGSPAMSAKVEKAEQIANYPGAGLLSGAELNRRFREHARAMDLTSADQMVTQILGGGDRYTLLAENQLYEARTVLLAIGASAPRGFPGEAELLGRGVSYCATCDGFLYRGKTIAVFCAAPRYEHEVEYLASLAEKVWLSAPYRGCGVRLPNVSPLPGPIRAIEGDNRVSRLRLADGGEVPVDGVFLLRTAVAPAVLLPGLAMDGPHIAVDREMRTNLPGCYAAGDCTGRPYQIAKAVGEGNTAAHSIVEYLARLETP